MSTPGLILACECAHRGVIPPAVRKQVIAALAAAGLRVTLVSDLCGLAARKDPLLATLASAAAPVVLACHPRAVRWLLHAAGVQPLPASLRLLNLRAQTAETILAQLGLTLSVPQPSPLPQIPDNPEPLTPPPPPDPWIPWFPVIDYDRCVQCRQCMSFCPFGVYSIQEARVTVTAPRNCKDNCPACARVCPHQAIIFPKVNETPIDGAEVTDDDLQAARQRLATREQDMAGGNIHSVLAQRKLQLKTRQSRNQEFDHG